MDDGAKFHIEVSKLDDRKLDVYFRHNSFQTSVWCMTREDLEELLTTIHLYTLGD